MWFVLVERYSVAGGLGAFAAGTGDGFFGGVLLSSRTRS